MRRVLKSLFLVVPMAIIVLAALIPMPIQWSVGGMLFGLLFFQLALVGSFDSMLPETRYYLELRAETDKLLRLVRELNAAAIDAKRVGIDPSEHTTPIVQQMHETVDRLPDCAGRSVDGQLHLTALAARQPGSPERVH